MGISSRSSLVFLLLLCGLQVSVSLFAQSDSPALLFSQRPIEAGIFGGLGTAVNDRIYGEGPSAHAHLNLANAGLRFGKVLTMSHGPRWLKSQFEWSAEFMPFWLASYPHQVLTLHEPNGVTGSNSYFGYDIRGVTFTPAQLRFNFAARGRFAPWAQIACGVLWTRNDFPSAQTSDVNFTPQLGLGTHLFVRPRRSLDFAVNAVHISNGNTANQNPGVNVTIQASIGFSFWGTRR